MISLLPQFSKRQGRIYTHTHVFCVYAVYPAAIRSRLTIRSSYQCGITCYTNRQKDDDGELKRIPAIVLCQETNALHNSSRIIQ